MYDILFKCLGLYNREFEKVKKTSENFLFSIIIPVYNKGEYLSSCLECLLNQTYSNFEIICINDGSTDNSLEILERFVQKDNRIKVFSQENKGASATRNLGIEKAQGEYLLFCDADDKFKPELCEVVAKNIKKNPVDVVAFAHEDYVDGKFNSVSFKNLQKLKKDNSLKNQLDLQIYIWEKAFRRDFIIKNEIQFPIGIKNAEDVIFCLKTLFSGATYLYIEEALYCYSREMKGKSTFTNHNGINNDLEAYKYFIETDIYKNLNKKEKITVTNFFIRGSIKYYKTLQLTEHKEKLINDLRKLSNVVINQFGLKTSLIKMRSFRRIYKILFKDNHKSFFDKFDIITTDSEQIFILAGLSINRKRKRHRVKVRNKKF